MATASSIMDAIVKNLSAASALGKANVGLDYSVLESSATCCVVVGFKNVATVQSDFGGGDDRDWTFFVNGYVKDNGNPCALMINVHPFVSTVVNSLRSDDTVQGEVAMTLGVVAGERNPEEVLIVSGHTWQVVPMEIIMREYA